MSVDPFPSFVDAIGRPYANALEITRAQIEAGDVDLPVISSCLRVQGSTGITRVKVTLASGDIATFRAVDCQDLEIRAVKIHQEIEDENGFFPPDSIIALW